MSSNIKMMENNLHNVAIDFHIFTTYQKCYVVFGAQLQSHHTDWQVDRGHIVSVHCGVKHYVHTITLLKLIVNSEVQRENATHTDNSQLLGSKKNSGETYQQRDVMFTGFLINYEN